MCVSKCKCNLFYSYSTGAGTRPNKPFHETEKNVTEYMTECQNWEENKWTLLKSLANILFMQWNKVMNQNGNLDLWYIFHIALSQNIPHIKIDLVIS